MTDKEWFLASVEQIKCLYNVKSDREVARLCGLHAPLIAQVRSNTRPAPVSAKARVADRLGLFKGDSVSVELLRVMFAEINAVIEEREAILRMGQ